MTGKTETAEGDSTDRGRPVGCGALSDDVTKAVEIISVRHQVPGSSAYQLLVNTAEGARLSVR